MHNGRPRHTAAANGFRRDRFTLLGYGATAYGVYGAAALGPAMPFLRDELGISYTTAGLHFTLMAVGTVVAGVSADRAIDRLGRRSVFWTAGTLLAVAAALLAFARHPVGSIAASALMGVVAASMTAAVQSALAIRHGALRALAFTEASVAASVGFLATPLIIGILDTAGLDWRLAFLVPAPAWSAIYVTQRSVAFPEPTAATRAPGAVARRLPTSYWAFWGSLLFSVAAEFTFVAWGASYLIERAGVEEGAAALLMTWFFVAMLLGRIAGSRLIRTRAPEVLIAGALATGVAGFGVWWVGTTIVVMAPGLFLAGLGISTLFPVLSSLAMGTAEDRPDLASSRIMLTAGLALLIAPQALAVVADSTSLAAAYTFTPVCLVLLAISTAAGVRLDRRRQAPS